MRRETYRSHDRSAPITTTICKSCSVQMAVDDSNGFLLLCVSSRTDFVWRVAWSEAVAGPAREIFKFAIEQSAYTLACNTSEAWAFSGIAQLSLENWHSPLFFERKMPCKHAPQHRIESDLIWMNLQLRKAVEQVPEKRNKVAPFRHKAHTPFKSQESLETCSQIRHVNSNLRLSDSPSGFIIMILWRDAYSFFAIKQSLRVILKLVLWLVNALTMQRCCKANCHCFPFSQALITPQCRAETTGLLSHQINETILIWSCRMWSYHEQHHELPICCVHAEP